MKLRTSLVPLLLGASTFLSTGCYALDKLDGLGMNSGTTGPLIVPNYLAKQEFYQAAGTFNQAQRSQQVYGASEFGHRRILITAIYWRPSPNYGSAFRTTVPQIQINLSTTSKQPDQLSSTFADNVGPDDKVVFNGALKLSSRFVSGVGGTKRFDMLVRLQHPFLYDPSRGNLLLDIRNFQGSTASLVDAYGQDGDGGSRAIALDPSAPSAYFMDTGIDVLEIVCRPLQTSPWTQLSGKSPSPRGLAELISVHAK